MSPTDACALYRSASHGVERAAMKTPILHAASPPLSCSLLKCLMGAYDQRHMTLTGTISANGEPLDVTDCRQLVSFVPALDLLPQGIAAHDALSLAADLRCDRELPRPTKERRLDDLEGALGLSGVRFMRVAAVTSKAGLSTGQRKRLGIAAELLGGPGQHPYPLILLDEPTSSVDAATAFRLMNFIKGFARTMGSTVVCVIHQPRHETFALVSGRQPSGFQRSTGALSTESTPCEMYCTFHT